MVFVFASGSEDGTSINDLNLPFGTTSSVNGLHSALWISLLFFVVFSKKGGVSFDFKWATTLHPVSSSSSFVFTSRKVVMLQGVPPSPASASSYPNPNY